MENQTNVVDPSHLTPDTPPVPAKQSRLSIWRLTTAVLIVLVIILVTFILLLWRFISIALPSEIIFNADVSSSKTASFPDRDSTDTSVPSHTPAVTRVHKPSSLILGSLSIPLTDNETPIFSLSESGIGGFVYLATSVSEAQRLSECAKQGNCNDGIRLSYLADGAVVNNRAVGDSIKKVIDIKFDKLTETKLDGKDAWIGYIDDERLTYQVVIDTSTATQKFITYITISSPEADKATLEKYVARLATLKVIAPSEVLLKELSERHIYQLDLSSSLISDNPTLTDTILSTLFSMPTQTTNYKYFLYTENTGGVSGKASISLDPHQDLLNFKYTLLTDNPSLQEGTYGTTQVTAKLTLPTKNNLDMYLLNPKYCNQDADCQYRSGYCSLGAYNAYHLSGMQYGCGPASIDGVVLNDTDLECSNLQMKYDSLKCINNTCTPINPEAVCQD